MGRITFPVAALAFIVGPVNDAEEPPTPKGGPPEFCLASAARSDGKVVVRISRMASTAREVVGGKEVYVSKNHWVASKEFVLGEQLRAYRVDGRSADPGEVLKALSKPSGVACFIGFVGPKPTPPDPFYLALLREDSVALAFEIPPDPPAIGRP